MRADVLKVSAVGNGYTPLVGDNHHRLIGLYRWLWKFIRPEWLALGGVFVLSILAVLAGLSQPYLTRALIDDGIIAGNRFILLTTAAWMVGLALFAMAIGFACRRIHVGASARMLHAVRESLFAHILTLSPVYLSRIRQGDLLVRLESDLGEVQRFAVDAALSAINSILMIIGTVIVLAMLSPTLALFLVVLTVLNGAVLSWVKPYVEAHSHQLRDAGVEVSSFLVEKLSAVRCIQTHSAEIREQSELQALHETVRARMLSLQLFGYFGGAFPNLLLSLAVIGIFVGGSLEYFGGEAHSLGTLVAFSTYIQRASLPLHSLMGLYLQWQRVKVGLVRVNELRNEEPSVAKNSETSAFPLENFEIAVRNLSFKYLESRSLVFGSLNFVVPQGSKVLLRGDSGAGKSTLIDLFHRHLVPLTGSISIGGVELQKIDPVMLRNYVVVVSQEAVLFAGSLAENIRYGSPGASDADIEKAAATAGVFEFIERLSGGLNTELGTRGAKLSSGERQRVALARALLMAPPVIIIDEGTASLDWPLEQRTLQAIDLMLPNSTRIFVSHRILDSAVFDQIIELS